MSSSRSYVRSRCSRGEGGTPGLLVDAKLRILPAKMFVVRRQKLLTEAMAVPVEFVFQSCEAKAASQKPQVSRPEASRYALRANCASGRSTEDCLARRLSRLSNDVGSRHLLILARPQIFLINPPLD
jgi:hypothetical protein